MMFGSKECEVKIYFDDFLDRFDRLNTILADVAAELNQINQHLEAQGGFWGEVSGKNKCITALRHKKNGGKARGKIK